MTLTRFKLPSIHRAKDYFTSYLFMAPALFFFGVFVFYPMIHGFWLSFQEIHGRKTVWVGLDNYINLFTDPIFYKSLTNTLLLVLGNVPVVILFSLFVANTIYKKHPVSRSLYRGIFYLPAVASVVSVTVVWSWIYHPRYGILNYLTGAVGIEPIAWLGDPQFALLAILIVMITVNVGQPIILYVASLGNIPISYIEAAEMDGATKSQVFTRIVWPLLMPTTLYIVIITTINSFQVFAFIQLLTSGGPAYSTTTLMYQIYEKAFQLGEFGQSAAMGMILAAVIMAISVVQYKFFSSDVEY